MRKLLFFVLAAIMFVACGKDDFGFNSQPEVQNPFAVTPDEAVQMLQSVIGGNSTRAMSIAGIKTLTKSNFVPSTRSGADDAAVYIIDIEGGGSAIMSADKRMEPIYAIMDKTKLSAEKLVGASTRSTSDEENDIEDFVLGLLNNAIQRDIEASGQRAVPELPLIPRDQLWMDTTVVAYRPQMMNTIWHQGDPFNRRYGYVTGTTQRYKAGCGPIALAQILYYNRYPNSINGETFDWDLIAQYEADVYWSASEEAIDEVANFVYQIKVRSNALPTGNGTDMGLLPAAAAAFMRNTGYPDAALVSYSTSGVIDMVGNKHLPVYVTGEGVNDTGDPIGHAWVIDGCNVYTVDYWVRHYTNQFLYTEYIESTRNFNYFHCNMGGELGFGNGTYSSAVFNTPTGSYNTNLQIVTYSLD